MKGISEYGGLGKPEKNQGEGLEAIKTGKVLLEKIAQLFMDDVATKIRDHLKTSTSEFIEKNNVSVETAEMSRDELMLSLQDFKIHIGGLLQKNKLHEEREVLTPFFKRIDQALECLQAAPNGYTKSETVAYADTRKALSDMSTFFEGVYLSVQLMSKEQ
jgi:hypothetical protein